MTLLKKILPLVALLALILPASAFAQPKSKIRFSTASAAVAEGDPGDGLTHSVTINVTRKKFLNQAISVNYTVGGSAAPGVDYTGSADGQPLGASGTISWAAGDGSSKAITIDVASDFDIEGIETIALALKSPSRGAMVLNPSRATVSIVDNDGPTQVQLDSASYSVSESGGPTLTMHVLRSGNLTGTSSVTATETDGTAHLGSDFTETGLNPHTVSFAVGEFDKTIDFSITDDPEKETTEDFNVALSNPVDTTLAAISSATASILDDDAAPVFYLNAASYSANESDGSFDVTVTRNTDPFIAGTFSGTASVDWTTADGTAVAPDDYTAAPANPDNTLTFDPGDSEETFTVQVSDDSLVEGDETFGLALGNPVDGVLGSPNSAVAMIHDNDTPAGGGSANPVGGSAAPTSGTGTGTPSGQQNVLGSSQSACALVVKATKIQKLLKQKGLKLKLRSGQRCKVSLATTIKQLKSKSKTRQVQIVRALRLKGNKASLTLQPGKAKTVMVKFTKKTLKAITKALRARKKLVATVVVTERDSASKLKRRTLKITIRR
ncbi:MAG: Calx-beta domain-containing protein [Thermoleophilaceae bacterium]